MTYRALKSILVIAATGITALGVGAVTAVAAPVAAHVQVVADSSAPTPAPNGAEWG
ncbi:MAG TPA: hypothetical protein VHF06_14470 [Pseudonocardiaceae bacterium]|jgi:hypothetical protein|nr:hypothetical protein [Pseudonocardiaceae bacterium]